LNKVLDSGDLLTRFLLDEVDERERAVVEDRLLSETVFYEQMLEREAELTDAYVRGELSHDERKRFEKSFFASRDRRKRVEFAEGLAESATLLQREESAKPASAITAAGSPSKSWLASFFTQRPAISYALAAAALVVLGVAIWFSVERMRAPVQPQRARTEGDPSPKPGQQDSAGASGQEEKLPTAREAASPTPSQTPERDAARDRAVFAAITLMPGAVRDGAAGANLLVPRGATHLRVRLQLEEDKYRNYQAVVSTPEGRKVWAGSAPKDREKDALFVTLTMPAALLARGDYVIELAGAAADGRSEPTAQYSFRVMREN
jgi:hypothetical protein